MGSSDQNHPIFGREMSDIRFPDYFNLFSSSLISNIGQNDAQTSQDFKNNFVQVVQSNKTTIIAVTVSVNLKRTNEAGL